MSSGADTRDVSTLPLIVFGPPVRVAPGAAASLSFTVTNRYNQSIDAVHVDLAFSVGGSWLEARRLNLSDPDVPRFNASMPVPFAIAAGASRAISLPIATTARTVAGVYLVWMTMSFQYVNASAGRSVAHLASLGSIAPADRPHVDMDNYTATLDALGLDGIVPDSSITVDDGSATALWLAAAAFGVAVVAIGASYGWLKRRRRTSRGH